MFFKNVGSTTSTSYLPWSILETFQNDRGEWLELDLETLAQLSGADFTSATTTRQVELSQQLKVLEKDVEKLKTEKTFVNSAIIAQVLHKPGSKHFIKSMCRSQLNEIQKELYENINNLFPQCVKSAQYKCRAFISNIWTNKLNTNKYK